ncbi:hypothetical protein AcW1_008734 [Taiwanofungus camphoratus]|nr:hypothetical protein AcW1_008734 [Antrodia cinnamomea]
MASPYRRRRIIWTVLIFSAISIFYVSHYTPSSFWSLPESLKGLGFSPSSSRAGQVGLAKLKEKRIREIDGLLHFVTAHADRRLNEDDGYIKVDGLGRIKVDPDKGVDFSVYAPDGDVDWDSHLKTLKADHPLVVFSKTFCPFSQRAKSLLKSYDIYPPPTIVELNTRSDGPLIQQILLRLTDRRTVPNVLLLGESLGGSDDVHQLHDEHKLKALLEGNGLQVFGV